MENFRQLLLDSFVRVFIEQNAKYDIILLISAIQQNSISEFIENKNSISTIFSPFHFNQVYPFNIKEIHKIHPLNPKLISFMKLCSRLESMTEKLDYNDFQANQVYLLKLKKTLESFLTIIPSKEELKSWLTLE